LNAFSCEPISGSTTGAPAAVRIPPPSLDPMSLSDAMRVSCCRCRWEVRRHLQLHPSLACCAGTCSCTPLSRVARASAAAPLSRVLRGQHGGHPAAFGPRATTSTMPMTLSRCECLDNREWCKNRANKQNVKWSNGSSKRRSNTEAHRKGIRKC
jgi:hypothetical protein